MILSSEHSAAVIINTQAKSSLWHICTTVDKKQLTSTTVWDTDSYFVTILYIFICPILPPKKSKFWGSERQICVMQCSFSNCRSDDLSSKKNLQLSVAHKTEQKCFLLLLKYLSSHLTMYQTALITSGAKWIFWVFKYLLHDSRIWNLWCCIFLSDHKYWLSFKEYLKNLAFSCKTEWELNFPLFFIIHYWKAKVTFTQSHFLLVCVLYVSVSFLSFFLPEILVSLLCELGVHVFWPYACTKRISRPLPSSSLRDSVFM